MTFFSLVKKGYGSLDYLQELDTPEIIKIIEYENIIHDLELIAIEESKQS